jgi:hypothetical protein
VNDKTKEKLSELIYQIKTDKAPRSAERDRMWRDRIIELTLGFARERATWFLRNWNGPEPLPTEEEVFSIACYGLVATAGPLVRAIRRKGVEHPIAYLEKGIDSALARDAYGEHIANGLPDVDGERGKMYQLEDGTPDGEGGFVWGEFDGTIVPVIAGTPYDHVASAGPTRDRPGRVFKWGGDGRRRTKDLKEEVLLLACETNEERRIVEMLLDERLTRREISEALGLSLQAVQDRVKRIRKRYETLYPNEVRRLKQWHEAIRKLNKEKKNPRTTR